MKAKPFSYGMLLKASSGSTPPARQGRGGDGEARRGRRAWVRAAAGRARRGAPPPAARNRRQLQVLVGPPGSRHSWGRAGMGCPQAGMEPERSGTRQVKGCASLNCLRTASCSFSQPWDAWNWYLCSTARTAGAAAGEGGEPGGRRGRAGGTSARRSVCVQLLREARTGEVWHKRRVFVALSKLLFDAVGEFQPTHGRQKQVHLHAPGGERGGAGGGVSAWPWPPARPLANSLLRRPLRLCSSRSTPPLNRRCCAPSPPPSE